MAYRAFLVLMDAVRDRLVLPQFEAFASVTGIPAAVPTFCFDFLYYLIPPALLTVGPLWILKKKFPHSWSPKRYYYFLAFFAFAVYAWYAYVTIPKVLNDPEFSLAFDLWGANSRWMTFADLVSMNIACIMHIALHYDAYEVPLSHAIFYMILSTIGVGHSLFMARIVDFSDKKSLPRPKRKVWPFWFVYGWAVFAYWFYVVLHYFAEWGNLNIFRNGGGPGLTPGANFAIFGVTWGTLEFVPYYSLQASTFFGAFLENLLDYSNVAAYFCRQLYLRDYYSDEDLPKIGIDLNWYALEIAKTQKNEQNGQKKPNKKDQ